MDNKQPSEPLSPLKKKQQNSEYQKRLDLIKAMNGFSDKIMNNPGKVESVELVLEELDRMNCVSHFKNLKTLTLINVNIYQIEGLEELQLLENLWLDENHIQKIDGLQNNVNLVRLHLSNNNIKQIQGLDNLVNLEILWLCNNRIDSLQNLQSLEKLKQLWIAGNQIEEIRISLDKLQNLNDLNISGNKICSFKEALNLNRLPNLKILSFYDPHFGENPICNLCNYQTYVLYHLRNITKLDTLFISDEAKSFAEATFMKKKMYYNMRIKTMQRSFSTLGKLIRKARKIKLDSLNEDIANLQLKINQMQSLNSKGSEFQDYKTMYTDKIEEITHVEEVYESMKKKLYENSSICIHKLITELETGGNIRLEEGKSNEKWYISCEDLIKSRFHKEDMIGYGIQDLQIKRVVRIHNRFLRNKFEEKMESLVDVSNSNYKKSLEYLFYGVDPNTPQEIYHVLEEGFRPYNECKQLGLCGYTPLVNSILGADSARLMSFLKIKRNHEKFKKAFIKRRFQDSLTIYPPGMLLICKVLMIKSVSDNKTPFFDPDVAPSDIFKSAPIDSKLFSEENTIYRVKENDPKHKLWFVIDNNLVLPEYLVEFNYILSNENQNKVSDFGDQIGILDNPEDEFISPKNIHIYKGELNNIYNTLCEEINNYQFENIEDLKHPNLEIKAQDLDRADISLIKITLLNYFKYCLSRSFLYELNPNLLQEAVEQEITQDMVLEQYQKNPEEILFVNLSNMKISEICIFPQLKNLQTLILSYNKILEIKNLDYYPHLSTLDLNHNQITSLSGLSSLEKLEIFDVSHNDIADIKEITQLQSNINLVDLKVIFNPFSEKKDIVNDIVQILPQLVYLDNKLINKESIQRNKEKIITEISDDMIKEYGKIIQSRSLSQLEPNWKETIEIINLSHLKLRGIKGLEQLVNLRQANFSHNLIEKIEGLSNCKLLEELSFEKNKITKISGLENLIYLKKMELGKNKINQISGLAHLSNLMQLSLEDNMIESLEDFPELKNLMELYLGNNSITESKEITNLKGLQKLIILDLSGNPFSRDPNYRIYTLFIIKKLKVLDGISIEASEQQLAKDLFTGRLTEEILMSRLYGQSAQEITELDLSNCKLRDFDEVFTHHSFPNLTELNLSANLFQSTRMLGYLPNLKILILNSNKIETLASVTDANVKKALNGCQNLEILDISNNNLKEFHGLQFCLLRELKILKAYRNEIYKIDCLEQLKSLRELDVNHNKVRQFDPMSFIGSNPIKCLKIDDNGLKNFNNIQRLYKLQHLFANSNRINDIPDIEKLSELTYLKELELNGNAFSRRPGYRAAVLKKLPTLLYLDGREVTIEERERLDGIPQQIDKGQNLPNIHMPSMNNQKGFVQVKLNSINFDGVFSKKLNQANWPNQQQF
ncbi:hypothetical protein ABPG74_010758 [Tetrahymena malaccensis]